jgi:hypothetical protein
VGVPADTCNKDGDTALHIAARAGHVEVGRQWVGHTAPTFVQQCRTGGDRWRCDIQVPT